MVHLCIFMKAGSICKVITNKNMHSKQLMITSRKESYLIKVINIQISWAINIPKHESQKPVTPTSLFIIIFII